MTVTLELSAGEAHLLQEIAGAAGVSVEAVLHGLINQLSLPNEAPTEDLEAAAERQREQAEVEANVRRWHEEREQR